jgi:hypothetical protein
LRDGDRGRWQTGPERGGEELEGELRRKAKVLTETAALIVLSKNGGDLSRRRGRMTRLEDRQTSDHQSPLRRLLAGARLRAQGRSAHPATLAAA